MSLRRKSVHRLAIIAAVVAVTGAGLGGAYLFKQSQHAARIAAAEKDGLSLFQAGQFADALPKLREAYLADPTKSDIAFALASSRANVEMAPGTLQHLAEARVMLTQLLRTDPTNEKASRLLMRLQFRTNAVTDLLATADQFLAQHPGDRETLEHRAAALSMLDRRGDAVEAWKAYAAAAPDDVTGATRALAAMRRAGLSAEQLARAADEFASRAATTSDLQKLLVRTEALRLGGDVETTRAQLREAAQTVAVDSPADVIALVDALDRAGAYDAALVPLQRAVTPAGEPSTRPAPAPALVALLAERQWQLGQFEAASKTLARLDAASLSTRARAIRAMSAFALGDKSAAQADVAQLTDVKHDGVAACWAGALKATLVDSPLAASDRVEKLRAALLQDEKNAVAHAWLADALAELGEVDRAAAHWDRAAELMPAWFVPLLNQSRAQLATGRVVDAVRSAAEAVRRAPQLRATRVHFALARFAALDAANDPTYAAALLADVEAMRKADPTDPTLAAIAIGLTARDGHADAARDLANRYLQSVPQLDDAGVTRLLDTSHQFDLGLDEAIIARGPKTASPDVALMRALESARSAPSDADPVAVARDARANLVAAAGGDAAKRPWRIAIARLAGRLAQPDAPDLWRAIGNDFPADLAAQISILDDARPLFATSDRAFLHATVDRLRKITGDEAQRWRVERARLLLDDGKPEDVAEAAQLARDLAREAPDRTDVRLILALALEKTDRNPTAAISHLRAAISDNPRDAAVALELVRMLDSDGNRAEATNVLRRLAGYEQPDPATRRAIVRTMASRDMVDDAVRALERNAASLLPAEKLQLAELYVAQRAYGRAEPLYASLLQQSPADPAVLASAASFERQRGNGDRVAELEKQLAKPASTPALEATRQLAIGLYRQQFGEVDAARAAFAAARAASPTREDLWLRSIELERSVNQPAAALKLADEALARLPGNAAITAERGEARAIVDAAANGANAGAVASLAATMSDDDPNQKLKSRALELYAEFEKTGKPSVDLARTMSQLAERFPSQLALQQRTIELCLATQLNDMAAVIARRTAERLPASPDAQQLAAATYRAIGQPGAARQYANRWRNLVPTGQTRSADELLASLAASEKRYADALAFLTPHREAILSDPDRSADALSTLARSIAGARSSDEAFALLTPRLGTSRGARVAWLDVCSGVSERDLLTKRLNEVLAVVPAEENATPLRIAIEALRGADRLADDAALAELAARIADAPSQRPDASADWLLVRGEGLRRSHDPASALAMFRRLVKTYPDVARGQNILAYALLQQKQDLDEALACATRATELSPGVPDYFDTLARVHLARGNDAEAEKAFKAALQRDESHLDALTGLASIQLKQNRKAEAGQLLARVDRIVGTTQAPARLRGELDGLRQGLSATRD
jgi:tetratricopeptide (TPR) repeat protein